MNSRVAGRPRPAGTKRVDDSATGADAGVATCRRACLSWLAVAPLLMLGLARVSAAQDGPTRVIDVRVENRRVVEPEGSIRVTQGDVIELRWTSDEPVDLHLHGYDRELRVEAGAPASMVVEAFASGRFPITSHGWSDGGHGHDALIFLEVYPD